MKKHLLVLVLLCSIIAACGGTAPQPTIPPATPDLGATVQAEVQKAMDSHPTQTPLPTYTPQPTFTLPPKPTEIPKTPLAPASSRSSKLLPITSENVYRITEIGRLELEGPFSDSIAFLPDIIFSPDSSLLAASSGYSIWLYDSETLSVVHLIEKTVQVGQVAFSPDGTLLAGGTPYDEPPQLWRVGDGTLFRTLEVPSDYDLAFGVVFSPDGKVLALGAFDSVLLWQIADDSLLRILQGSDTKPYPLGALAFSPDGKILASGSGLQEGWGVELWRVSDGELLHTLGGREDKPRVEDTCDVAFSPDGKMVAAGARYGVWLWQVADGTLAQTLMTPMEGVSETSVFGVAFSPDGSLLAVTKGGTSRSLDAMQDYNSEVVIFETETWHEVQTLSGPPGPGYSVAFSPDGMLLASVDSNGTVRLWGVPED